MSDKNSLRDNKKHSKKGPSSRENKYASSSSSSNSDSDASHDSDDTNGGGRFSKWFGWRGKNDPTAPDSKDVGAKNRQSAGSKIESKDSFSHSAKGQASTSTVPSVNTYPMPSIMPFSVGKKQPASIEPTFNADLAYKDSVAQNIIQIEEQHPNTPSISRQSVSISHNSHSFNSTSILPTQPPTSAVGTPRLMGIAIPPRPAQKMIEHNTDAIQVDSLRQGVIQGESSPSTTQSTPIRHEIVEDPDEASLLPPPPTFFTLPTRASTLGQLELNLGEIQSPLLSIEAQSQPPRRSLAQMNIFSSDNFQFNTALNSSTRSTKGEAQMNIFSSENIQFSTSSGRSKNKTPTTPNIDAESGMAVRSGTKGTVQWTDWVKSEHLLAAQSFDIYRMKDLVSDTNSRAQIERPPPYFYNPTPQLILTSNPPPPLTGLVTSRLNDHMAARFSKSQESNSDPATSTKNKKKSSKDKKITRQTSFGELKPFQILGEAELKPIFNDPATTCPITVHNHVTAIDNGFLTPASISNYIHVAEFVAQRLDCFATQYNRVVEIISRSISDASNEFPQYLVQKYEPVAEMNSSSLELFILDAQNYLIDTINHHLFPSKVISGAITTTMDPRNDFVKMMIKSVGPGFSQNEIDITHLPHSINSSTLTQQITTSTQGTDSDITYRPILNAIFLLQRALRGLVAIESLSPLINIILDRHTRIQKQIDLANEAISITFFDTFGDIFGLFMESNPIWKEICQVEAKSAICRYKIKNNNFSENPIHPYYEFCEAKQVPVRLQFQTLGYHGIGFDNLASPQQTLDEHEVEVSLSRKAESSLSRNDQIRDGSLFRTSPSPLISHASGNNAVDPLRRSWSAAQQHQTQSIAASSIHAPATALITNFVLDRNTYFLTIAEDLAEKASTDASTHYSTSFDVHPQPMDNKELLALSNQIAQNNARSGALMTTLKQIFQQIITYQTARSTTQDLLYQTLIPTILTMVSIQAFELDHCLVNLFTTTFQSEAEYTWSLSLPIPSLTKTKSSHLDKLSIDWFRVHKFHPASPEHINSPVLAYSPVLQEYSYNLKSLTSSIPFKPDTIANPDPPIGCHFILPCTPEDLDVALERRLVLSSDHTSELPWEEKVIFFTPIDLTSFFLPDERQAALIQIAPRISHPRQFPDSIKDLHYSNSNLVTGSILSQVGSPVARSATTSSLHKAKGLLGPVASVKWESLRMYKSVETDDILTTKNNTSQLQHSHGGLPLKIINDGPNPLETLLKSDTLYQVKQPFVAWQYLVAEFKTWFNTKRSYFYQVYLDDICGGISPPLAEIPIWLLSPAYSPDVPTFGELFGAKHLDAFDASSFVVPRQSIVRIANHVNLQTALRSQEVAQPSPFRDFTSANSSFFDPGAGTNSLPSFNSHNNPTNNRSSQPFPSFSMPFCALLDNYPPPPCNIGDLNNNCTSNNPANHQPPRHPLDGIVLPSPIHPVIQEEFTAYMQSRRDEFTFVEIISCGNQQNATQNNLAAFLHTYPESLKLLPSLQLTAEKSGVMTTSTINSAKTMSTSLFKYLDPNNASTVASPAQFGHRRERSPSQSSYTTSTLSQTSQNTRLSHFSQQQPAAPPQIQPSSLDGLLPSGLSQNIFLPSTLSTSTAPQRISSNNSAAGSQFSQQRRLSTQTSQFGASPSFHGADVHDLIFHYIPHQPPFVSQIGSHLSYQTSTGSIFGLSGRHKKKEASIPPLGFVQQSTSYLSFKHVSDSRCLLGPKSPSAGFIPVSYLQPINNHILYFVFHPQLQGPYLNLTKAKHSSEGFMFLLEAFAFRTRRWQISAPNLCTMPTYNPPRQLLQMAFSALRAKIDLEQSRLAFIHRNLHFLPLLDIGQLEVYIAGMINSDSDLRKSLENEVQRSSVATKVRNKYQRDLQAQAEDFATLDNLRAHTTNRPVFYDPSELIQSFKKAQSRRSSRGALSSDAQLSPSFLAAIHNMKGVGWLFQQQQQKLLQLQLQKQQQQQRHQLSNFAHVNANAETRSKSHTHTANTSFTYGSSHTQPGATHSCEQYGNQSQRQESHNQFPTPQSIPTAFPLDPSPFAVTKSIPAPSLLSAAYNRTSQAYSQPMPGSIDNLPTTLNKNNSTHNTTYTTLTTANNSINEGLNNNADLSSPKTHLFMVKEGGVITRANFAHITFRRTANLQQKYGSQPNPSSINELIANSTGLNLYRPDHFTTFNVEEEYRQSGAFKPPNGRKILKSPPDTSDSEYTTESGPGLHESTPPTEMSDVSDNTAPRDSAATYDHGIHLKHERNNRRPSESLNRVTSVGNPIPHRVSPKAKSQYSNLNLDGLGQSDDSSDADDVGSPYLGASKKDKSHYSQRVSNHCLPNPTILHHQNLQNAADQPEESGETYPSSTSGDPDDGKFIFSSYPQGRQFEAGSSSSSAYGNNFMLPDESSTDGHDGADKDDDNADNDDAQGQDNEYQSYNQPALSDRGEIKSRRRGNFYQQKYIQQATNVDQPTYPSSSDDDDDGDDTSHNDPQPVITPSSDNQSHENTRTVHPNNIQARDDTFISNRHQNATFSQNQLDHTVDHIPTTPDATHIIKYLDHPIDQHDLQHRSEFFRLLMCSINCIPAPGYEHQTRDFFVTVDGSIYSLSTDQVSVEARRALLIELNIQSNPMAFYIGQHVHIYGKDAFSRNHFNVGFLVFNELLALFAKTKCIFTVPFASTPPLLHALPMKQSTKDTINPSNNELVMLSSDVAARNSTILSYYAASVTTVSKHLKPFTSDEARAYLESVRARHEAAVNAALQSPFSLMPVLLPFLLPRSVYEHNSVAQGLAQAYAHYQSSYYYCDGRTRVMPVTQAMLLGSDVYQESPEHYCQTLAGIVEKYFGSGELRLNINDALNSSASVLFAFQAAEYYEWSMLRLEAVMAWEKKRIEWVEAFLSCFPTQVDQLLKKSVGFVHNPLGLSSGTFKRPKLDERLQYKSRSPQLRELFSIYPPQEFFPLNIISAVFDGSIPLFGQDATPHPSLNFLSVRNNALFQIMGLEVINGQVKLLEGTVMNPTQIANILAAAPPFPFIPPLRIIFPPNGLIEVEQEALSLLSNNNLHMPENDPFLTDLCTHPSGFHPVFFESNP